MDFREVGCGRWMFSRPLKIPLLPHERAGTIWTQTRTPQFQTMSGKKDFQGCAKVFAHARATGTSSHRVV